VRPFESLEPRLLFFATGGDFNGDGIVAAADLVLVRTNWGTVVEEQLPGWVGMQPDERVDQNELDAVLLNWLQIVDPETQGARAETAEEAVSGSIEAVAPAPILEASQSQSGEPHGESSESGDRQVPSPVSKAPTSRAVRDAAFAALAGGRGRLGLKRAEQIFEVGSAPSRRDLMEIERGKAGGCQRDAAFADSATGCWLAAGRVASPLPFAGRAAGAGYIST
jgi:hypothetical protein